MAWLIDAHRHQGSCKQEPMPLSWHHAIRSHGSHQRAMRSASLRSRLDLGSIFGARQASRTPPVERHGTPRNRPTRTGRQQGRAPNQDKRRLGARPAAAAVAGPGDEGATLYWLVIVNERMRWLGWDRRDVDAGLPMDLWLGAGMQADVAWGLGMACSYALGCFGTFDGRYLSVPYGFRVMPDLWVDEMNLDD